ncbi:hypothetical protein F7725_004751 [Dissostichus mawsoni]|uniref:GIY-YIG domain-containing protein n=1 Tax=Dissostichus mawsoni TaxID=36200 RepID=A0A7J5XL34_DISMA|nr:hypothetical protein F7725_004751 [Dissostichus mawsoni]
MRVCTQLHIHLVSLNKLQEHCVSSIISCVRICAFPEHVKEATSTLFSALRPRGYSRCFLRSIKAEVGITFKDKYNTISTQPSGLTLVPLITTYSKDLGSLLGDLRSNFEGARADSDALRQCRLISTYRRNKNLKDLLVHTNFNKKTPNREAPRVSEVGFIRLPHIFNPFSRAGANLGQALTPNTKNAVYAVRCRACHRLYVMETRNEISLRIKQHIYKINSSDGTTFYMHILNGPDKVQSLGLESNRDCTVQRQAAERRWIHRLKTIDPDGLNERYR